MNTRARDLSTIMGGQLAWVGPGVRLLSVSELAAWMTIRMECVDDARLHEIAEDFDLTQATLQRLGRTWFRQVTSTEGYPSEGRPSVLVGLVLTIRAGSARSVGNGPNTRESPPRPIPY